MDDIESAYDAHDALGLAELLRRGEIRAGELLAVARRRCEERGRGLNAFVLTCFDEAERELESGLPAADENAPLRGLPFAIKDLFADVAGLPTTNGSRFFGDPPAARDSDIVARYRRAGLLIIGKTSTPEFGLNATTEPVANGATRNPWSAQHSSGGSSGGAAAATAGGMLPFAHATDGGGSIRIPASCCGLFGLKPTRGRTPQGPDRGERWSGLSIGHAVTRSVRDSAALLDATAGTTPGDPYVAPHAARPFLEELRLPVGRLRVAFSTRAPTGGPVDPECVKAVHDAIALCGELGHETQERDAGYDAAALGAAQRTIVSCHLAATIRQRAAALGREPGADDVENAGRTYAAMGTGASGLDYVAALDTIHRLGREMARFQEQIDVYVTPTLAEPPLPLGALDADGDLQEFGATALRYTPFTGICNATGQPAASVPLAWSGAGLPIGVQIVGRFGEEATLLRLAAQLEQARPWAFRRPPVPS